MRKTTWTTWSAWLLSRRASGPMHASSRRRTRTHRCFLMLYMLAGLKRWRRGTLRFHEENARIEAWLARIEVLATANYPVAVELAKAQRLVKGYGETHERGWRSFSTLLEQVELL